MYSILPTLAWTTLLICQLQFCSADDANHDTSKTKKIQIVYIKVPLANKMRNANDGNYAESNDNQVGFTGSDNSGSSNPISNAPKSNYNAMTMNGAYNQNNLAADLVNLIRNHQPNGDYPQNQMETSYNGNSGFGNYNGPEQLAKRPNYPMPLTMSGGNGGYSISGANQMRNNFRQVQAPNKQFNPQPNLIAINKVPIIQSMNGLMNNFNGYDQANNAGGGRGANNGAYNGPMISLNPASHNANGPSSFPMTNNAFRDDYPNNNMPKPHMGQPKPIGEGGMDGTYGSSPSDPLPFANENPDSVGGNYNPSEFFGSHPPTSFDGGLEDGFPFGDLSFDGDSLLNFGGMSPYSGDLAKAPSSPRPSKGYGFIVSNALSGLGLLGSPNSNNDGRVKGMAMAMSNSFPSFVGPKPTSNPQSGGFGGIRSRLTSLFTARIPGINLNGLGSGLGGINSGLLGLLGL